MREGWWWPLAALAAVVGAIVVVLLIVEDGSTSNAEAVEAIEALPYRVSVRDAAGGALVGSARGAHEVVVHFAVSRNGPEPHDIPSHLIQADRNVTGGGGFWVWDDAEAWFQHGTRSQWREAVQISVGIEEALCRKATGDACPI